MSDLRFNSFSAAVLASGLAVLGLDQLSAAIFEQDVPEKNGYLIEVTDTGSAASHSEQDEAGIDLEAALLTADIEAGRKVAKKCIACHAFEKGGESKQGPPLWGIENRDIGSYQGFTYSEALIELPGSWSTEAIYEYLRSPKRYAPGTAMNFIGLRKSKDRVNIVAYLRSLAD